MATPIQEALRGTRETIRFIGQDQAASKRRVAESKLLNAQLGYKKAAAESDLEFKQKDQQLRVDKFNLLKESNAPMALGDYLDLVIVDPAVNEKVKTQIGEERLSKEYKANILSQAGNAILKQFGPKPTIEGEFAPGTVVETDPSGKKTVLQSPIKTDKRTKTISDLELEDEVTNRFIKEHNLSTTDARLKAQSFISENKKGAGISISTDKEGNQVISIGGKAKTGELTKGTKTGVEKKLLESNATYSDMIAIVNKVEDKFLEMPTKLGNRWTAFKEKWKVGDVSSDEKQKLQEYTAFKRDSISALNAYIKQITGAAMSELEAKRLMKAMPTPGIGLFDGDSPTEFKTKLEGVMESLDRVTARNNYIVKHGLTSFEDVGLDQIDGIIDTRGGELEREIRKSDPLLDNPTIEKQVIQILSEEFGIRF